MKNQQHQNVSYEISQFLKLNWEEFLCTLSSHHSINHIEQASLQTAAWKREFDDLKQMLPGLDGRILFEYAIPGLPKTIDVVLLINGVIFVLEYKVNAESYKPQDLHQVNGYALRLKYFHSTSNDNWIVPILVATDATNHYNTFAKNNDDNIFLPLFANSVNLKNIIRTTLSKLTMEFSRDWENRWEHGIFKASPTIISAARDVWKANNVAGFSLGEADQTTRLGAEQFIANVIVPQTKERPQGQNKSIVFVTGVPGAGKTLVGLNTSVLLQDEGASMLSGNGPLVKVLTSALKKDLSANKNNLNKPINQISIETIIRDAYGYKKEIFEKRLSYIPGSGEVTLKEHAIRGSQHVIIFDEAQRSWTQAKMIKPGQNKRKDWQEPQFPFSEPAILLWDMDQRDWGIFVCLVGGGQEINEGEAGICEWLESVKTLFPNWHVYMSRQFKGKEYDSSDGIRTVENYIQEFDKEGRIHFDDSLHLTASKRSIRNSQVSEFIGALLDCKEKLASELYKKIRSKYHIYITRDIAEAKKYLRKRKAEISDISQQAKDDIRMGMLMSSKASRIRPLGYEIKKVGDYLNKVDKWFLNSPSFINSSDFLEIALNEFFVQGLELDLVGLIWDADFRYNPSTNSWDTYEFNEQNNKWGKRDGKNESQVIKRFYMKNAYRVLLTRARIGMIICVPRGTGVIEDISIDPTRNHVFYDDTYEYLKKLGLEEL